MVMVDCTASWDCSRAPMKAGPVQTKRIVSHPTRALQSFVHHSQSFWQIFLTKMSYTITNYYPKYEILWDDDYLANGPFDTGPALMKWDKKCIFSGFNGTLNQEISVVKLSVTAKTTTCMIRTIRPDVASLPHYLPGEPLQHGEIPPALLGHSLTLINRSSDGKYQALLWWGNQTTNTYIKIYFL